MIYVKMEGQNHSHYVFISIPHTVPKLEETPSINTIMDWWTLLARLHDEISSVLERDGTSSELQTLTDDS